MCGKNGQAMDADELRAKRKEILLPIYDITPFTMIDYPDHMACILWLSGCNLRCLYCHNPAMIREKGRYSVTDAIEFLQKRRGFLEGVVISGGEATLYPGLPDLLRKIGAAGFKIKLDTNGLRPDVVAHCLAQGLVDYIALDYKAPAKKFQQVTGMDRFDRFAATLDLLCAQDKVIYEARTTVHSDLLQEDDINSIIDDLARRGFSGRYYVQNFRDGEGISILGNLPSQSRVLDLAKIKTPTTFSIEVRNFPVAAPKEEMVAQASG